MENKSEGNVDMQEREGTPLPPDGEPAWHVDPEAPLTPPIALSHSQLCALIEKSESRIWETTGIIGRSEIRRFSEDHSTQWLHKPLWMTLAFGVPGILLLAGQFWAVELCRVSGWELGAGAGWLRLGMIFVGA